MSERPDHEGDRIINIRTGDRSQVAAAGGNQSDVRQVQLVIGSEQREEIDTLLQLLRRAVDQDADKADAPDAVRAQADVVEAQLRSDRPHLETVKGLLSGMAKVAGDVTSIVNVVTRLQGVLGALG